jgi:hypothetical protein
VRLNLRRALQSKEQVSDPLPLVEVGRLELPYLALLALPHYAAAMAESGR